MQCQTFPIISELSSKDLIDVYPMTLEPKVLVNTSCQIEHSWVCVDCDRLKEELSDLNVFLRWSVVREFTKETPN